MTLEINRLNSGLVQTVQPRSPAVGMKQVAPGVDAQESEPQLSMDKVKLTESEEEYFASAFPLAAKEIRQHVLYQRTGIQRPSSLGSVIDRKG